MVAAELRWVAMQEHLPGQKMHWQEELSAHSSGQRSALSASWLAGRLALTLDTKRTPTGDLEIVSPSRPETLTTRNGVRLFRPISTRLNGEHRLSVAFLFAFAGRRDIQTALYSCCLFKIV